MDPENGRKIRAGYCIFCENIASLFSSKDAGSLCAIRHVKYLVLTLCFQRYAPEIRGQLEF